MKKMNNGSYPFFNAIYKNNTEMVKLLIDYAYRNKIILKIYEKEKDLNNLLLRARKNIKMIKLLTNYAINNIIILELNGKDNDNEFYPLINAIDKYNTEMVKLLIDYANKNKIVLEINEKDKYGYYPLLISTLNDDVEMVKY